MIEDDIGREVYIHIALGAIAHNSPTTEIYTQVVVQLVHNIQNANGLLLKTITPPQNNIYYHSWVSRTFFIPL